MGHFRLQIWTSKVCCCCITKNGDWIDFFSLGVEISHFLWVTSPSLSPVYSQGSDRTWHLFCFSVDEVWSCRSTEKKIQVTETIFILREAGHMDVKHFEGSSHWEGKVTVVHTSGQSIFPLSAQAHIQQDERLQKRGVWTSLLSLLQPWLKLDSASDFLDQSRTLELNSRVSASQPKHFQLLWELRSYLILPLCYDSAPDSQQCE